MGGSKGFSRLMYIMTAMPLRFWPMFRIENLSGSKATLESGSRSCLAREFLGGETFAKGNGCGTFDGLSYWDWDSFETFLKVFVNEMLPDRTWSASTPRSEVPIVGIYESQFIPPEWYADGTIESGDACSCK